MYNAHMGGRSSTVSEEYRAALREGMERARAVGRYLDALREHRPRRGRKRTVEGIRTRLAQIDEEFPTASGLARLRMMQEQKNLQKELVELERAGGDVDVAALEEDFIRYAKAFGDKDGIEYSTWIEYGVPRDVLAKAGITPTARRGKANGSGAGERTSTAN
jgi:hypothetical protein